MEGCQVVNTRITNEATERQDKAASLYWRIGGQLARPGNAYVIFKNIGDIGGLTFLPKNWSKTAFLLSMDRYDSNDERTEHTSIVEMTWYFIAVHEEARKHSRFQPSSILRTESGSFVKKTRHTVHRRPSHPAALAALAPRSSRAARHCCEYISTESMMEHGTKLRFRLYKGQPPRS